MTQAYTLDVVGKYPAHSGLLLGLIQACPRFALALMADAIILMAAAFTSLADSRCLLGLTPPPRSRQAVGFLAFAIGPEVR